MPERSPGGKSYRYTPYSMIGVGAGLGIGLTFGKAVGEALGWGKLATVTAECVIAGLAALAIALAINLLFGKRVEVRAKTRAEAVPIR